MRTKLRQIVASRWHGIPAGLIFSYLALVSICLGIVSFYFPARSLLWHAANGKIAKVGGETVELPLMWWRESSNKDAAIVLKHARLGVLDTSDIRVSPFWNRNVTQSDDVAQAWQLGLEQAINRSGKAKVVAISINAPIGTIFCLRDRSSPIVATLICQAGKMPWGIGFAGLHAEEEQAESILATLK